MPRDFRETRLSELAAVAVLSMRPMRIVSLACSNTEIVTALGCAHFLVGVDDHSDYPDHVVRSLPRVGPDLEISVEEVAKLEPDLVLASLTVPGHETVVEGVEAAGLPHLTLAPASLDDVFDNILLVGHRLEAGGVEGVEERAAEVVAEMRRELTPVKVAAAERPGTRPSILIQWWPKPVIAPCRQSWVEHLIDRAGGRNPLSGEDRPSRPLDDAEVVQMAPDAIVLSWCGVAPAQYRPDVVYRNPAFRDLPAVRRGRVFCVPEAYLGRPGPRLTDGVKALRKVVEATRAGRTA